MNVICCCTVFGGVGEIVVSLFYQTTEYDRGEQSGPVLAGAGPNARPRRWTHLSSGVMTSSCSVNRATAFLVKLFQQNNYCTVYEYQNKGQIIGVNVHVLAAFFGGAWLMWPLATRMFMTDSLLLWWTFDSVLLPVAIKPKVVKEALQRRSERRTQV